VVCLEYLVYVERWKKLRGDDETRLDVRICSVYIYWEHDQISVQWKNVYDFILPSVVLRYDICFYCG